MDFTAVLLITRPQLQGIEGQTDICIHGNYMSAVPCAASITRLRHANDRADGLSVDMKGCHRLACVPKYGNMYNMKYERKM